VVSPPCTSILQTYLCAGYINNIPEAYRQGKSRDGESYGKDASLYDALQNGSFPLFSLHLLPLLALVLQAPAIDLVVPTPPKKHNLRPKREKRNMNNFPFPFHTQNVWVLAETKQVRNRFTHKSISFRINEFFGFLKESRI
jgi:hypothetical protein